MNPKNRHFHFFLDDIILSMERILEYIEGLNFEQFKRKYIVVDAVIRNFEIIGEASKHIPVEFIQKYPKIPWKKMYRLRNIVMHEYFGIDYEMIWEIAKSELPANLEDLYDLVEKENIKRSPPDNDITSGPK